MVGELLRGSVAAWFRCSVSAFRDHEGNSDNWAIGYVFVATLVATTGMLFSRLWMGTDYGGTVIFALLVGLVVAVMVTATWMVFVYVMFLVARRLGGHGELKALMWSMALIDAPSFLLTMAASTWLGAIPVAGSILGRIALLGVFWWAVWQRVNATRAIMGTSIVRSGAAVLTPYVLGAVVMLSLLFGLR